MKKKRQKMSNILATQMNVNIRRSSRGFLGRHSVENHVKKRALNGSKRDDQGRRRLSME